MDRQDIDALLIGALYGELTPADEARLAAHLESHPTDRGALDDLKNTRAAVRDSQFFALQLDPPQAVSALLLQEAHRRAPKRVVAKETEEKESWFYRFTRYFMAHPAMAAAAMLVLVVGVAGTMYMRKGDTSAVDQAGQNQIALDNHAAETPPAGAATTTPPPPAAEEADQGEAGGDRYRADLDSAKLEAEQQELAKQSDREVKLADKKKAIMLERPQLQPKELDEKPPRKVATKSGAKNDSFASPADDLLTEGTVAGTRGTSVADGRTGGGGAATGAAAPARNAPTAAPATTATATTTKASKPSIAKEAERPEPAPAPAQDNTLLAWAKTEHNRALSLAKNGDCRAAAKVAVNVQNRAPEYYQQYMGTDRGLKNCSQYIANERDAEAERSGKARAQKRVNADEAAPAQVK